MFLYSFTRYGGHDKVFASSLDGVSKGDLIMIDSTYYLVLGDDIARKEQYNETRKYGIKRRGYRIVISGLLSNKTMKILHRFAYYRYTTYKNTVPLRIGDIFEILKRKKQNQSSIDGIKQKLVVFPDLWTLENTIQGGYIQEMVGNDSVYCVLHGKSTKKQRAECFWGLKNGTIDTLVCTYSQMFQDRKGLDRIILVDSHKWYYKNQKDPRYYLPSVVNTLQDIYKCKVVNMGFCDSMYNEMIESCEDMKAY